MIFPKDPKFIPSKDKVTMKEKWKKTAKFIWKKEKNRNSQTWPKNDKEIFAIEISIKTMMDIWSQYVELPEQNNKALDGNLNTSFLGKDN